MVTWLVALCLGVSVANAADFYIEGPMLDARRDATTMSRAASDLGYRARVVRRYAQGVGWRFVLVVEGFDEEHDATSAATAVAAAVGREVTLYQQEDGAATRLQTLTPSTSSVSSSSDEPRPDEGAFSDDVTSVLARAAVAHGGTTHPVVTAPVVLFRFRRTLPTGLVALHTVVRKGRDLYVQVDIEAGQGVSSKAWIIGDQAWLSAAGGEPQPQDAVWSREQLEQFLPQRVLALPLTFGQASTHRREFQLLYADGTVRSGDTRCLVLKYDGDQVSAPLELYLEQDRLLTRRVVSGTDVRNYDEYEDVASGAVAPFHLFVTREGEAVDEVRVLDLDLDPELDVTWFTPPI